MYQKNINWWSYMPTEFKKDMFTSEKAFEELRKEILNLIFEFQNKKIVWQAKNDEDIEINNELWKMYINLFDSIKDILQDIFYWINKINNYINKNIKDWNKIVDIDNKQLYFNLEFLFLMNQWEDFHHNNKFLWNKIDYLEYYDKKEIEKNWQQIISKYFNNDSKIIKIFNEKIENS